MSGKAYGTSVQRTSICMVRNTKTESFARRTHNKQLQRTVKRYRGDTASAPLHYALAVRFTRQRAAAELRR
jgi:hypothetical protein